MSIFKETFADYVKKQLKQRENIIASGTGKSNDKFLFNENRSNNFFSYQSKQCIVRLSSGVNIIDEGLLDEGLTGADIAKKWVLEGGIKDGNTNRGGIGPGGAYGDSDLRSDADDGYGIVPMPGITGANIRTKSAYGSLREAKINFAVHNRRQLEIMELLYMRPGYTLLLEWQWTPFVDNDGNMDYSSFKKINFFDSTQTTAKIEAQIQEYQEETGGNYDALIGYCKNFTYKLRPDGGFDCETELIAKGDILESLTDKESSIRFRDGATSRFASRPNIELFFSQMIALNNAVEGIGELNSGNATSLTIELAPKIGLTATDPLDPYILTGGSAAYTTFTPSATDDFWGRGIQDTDERGGFLGMGKRYRTSTTWVRWDAFCHFLNKEVIPLDEHKKPLCEFTTAYITAPDENSQVKFKPLLYSSKFASTAHITKKIQTLRGYDFDEETNSFQATGEDRLIQFKGLCDISTNNQICMLPHNLKAYDNLSGYEKYEGESWGDWFSGTSDYIKEGILKKTFYKPLINSLAEKNSFSSVSGFGKDRVWTENDPECVHNIGGIYFGVEYLYKKFREDYYDSEGNVNKDFSLFKYIKDIWEEVNAACVGNHDFDLQTDNTPGGKTIRVIDRQVDNSFEKIKDIYTLKIQSLDSVVQDITYNTTIPSSLSSTIAIAAQAPDSIDDLDKVSFAALNKGIQDRFTVSHAVKTTPSKDQKDRWLVQHQEQLINIYDALYIPPAPTATNNNDKSDRQIADDVGGGGTLRILLYRWYQEAKNYILKEDNDGADIESTSEFKGAVKNVRNALNFFLTHYGSTDESRGYWVGQPATDSHSPLSAIIPLKFNAKLDGISGIKIGSVFKLPKDRLPLAYNGDDINFIVMGEEQNIDENQNWTTSISGHLILLGDVNSEEYVKSKHYKSWQNPNLEITEAGYLAAPELGDLATGVFENYEPGSQTFDNWPGNELGDPLKTMFITSDFGPRDLDKDPSTPPTMHNGIDLRYHDSDEDPNRNAVPFYAVGTGTITKVKSGGTAENGGNECGGQITLTLARDPKDLTEDFSATSPKYITHCHVRQDLFNYGPKENDKVKKGDLLGYVGGGKEEGDAGRGNSSHRHLHMSYRTAGDVALNPARWMPGVGGDQADGAKSLYNYEFVDAMPGKDSVKNYIVKPLEGKTSIVVTTITPGEDEREDAMINPNKADEQTWYLVKDGEFKQTGIGNDGQAYVRISKKAVGAKVLDGLENVFYDPDWFTSGVAIFKADTYRGNVPFPLYDPDNFTHDTLNFPNHMHYNIDGEQMVPNKAATWFSEWEVAFSNDVGPNTKCTIEGKVHNE